MKDEVRGIIEAPNTLVQDIAVPGRSSTGVGRTYEYGNGNPRDAGP